MGRGLEMQTLPTIRQNRLAFAERHPGRVQGHVQWMGADDRASVGAEQSDLIRPIEDVVHMADISVKIDIDMSVRERDAQYVFGDTHEWSDVLGLKWRSQPRVGDLSFKLRVHFRVNQKTEASLAAREGPTPRQRSVVRDYSDMEVGSH